VFSSTGILVWIKNSKLFWNLEFIFLEFKII
jgi:hypothetical protein